MLTASMPSYPPTPTYLPAVPHHRAATVYLSVCKPTNQTTE